MIKEYAVDPELIASWTKDLSCFKRYKNSFGTTQGRFISDYPKSSWRRETFQLLEAQNIQNYRLVKEIEDFKISLKSPGKISIKRKGGNSAPGNWSKNAIIENKRFPFSSILVRENPGNRTDFIDEITLAEENPQEWDSPHGQFINRTVSEMVGAVRPLLLLCKNIKFVDPYLGTCRQSYKATMSAFLEILCGDRPVGKIESIEIHTGNANEHKCASATYLRKFFDGLIPKSEVITVYSWEEIGRATLHNRYVLTDLGGVLFGHGLDNNDEGSQDNVVRLTEPEWKELDKQYKRDSSFFKLSHPNPLSISGR